MPTPGTSLYWVATSLLHHVVVDPDVQATSILFPIMLVLLIGIRKLLDFVFTPKELKV